MAVRWNTWHNNVWFFSDVVTLAYDQWYEIGFAWGGPDNIFEIWVDGGLCAADSRAPLPWGASYLGTGSATNIGFGDNHQRGVDGYGSTAGATFADVAIWRGYQPQGDTEGDFDCSVGPVELAIDKSLTSGPEEIGIAGPAPTPYVFEIAYSNPDPSTPVRIVDTVPAEFECLYAVLDPSAGDATCAKVGNGINGANRIEWDLDAGTGTASLSVEVETVASPGGGHKDGTIYKPTSCGPLAINDGAVAYEVDPATGEIVKVLNPDTGLFEPVVIVGPSNSLGVEAVAGAKDCEDD